MSAEKEEEAILPTYPLHWILDFQLFHRLRFLIAAAIYFFFLKIHNRDLISKCWLDFEAQPLLKTNPLYYLTLGASFFWPPWVLPAFPTSQNLSLYLISLHSQQHDWNEQYWFYHSGIVICLGKEEMVSCKIALNMTHSSQKKIIWYRGDYN